MGLSADGKPHLSRYGDNMKTKIKENEFWWGGVIHEGRLMPFGNHTEYRVNLAEKSAGNQSAPFFLSTAGRYLYSEKPFEISFENGNIVTEDAVVIQSVGHTLRDAYTEAMQKFFPFSEKTPDAAFFRAPQYNTWAELTYGQNQESVLEYAAAVLQNGYKPGVMMIDDTWQLDYGMWQFDCSRFPNPKAMVEQLHDMGFRVMLWVAPYLSPDSPSFRAAEQDSGRLLRDEAGNPVIAKWWNGYSAVLDMAKPADVEWIYGVLEALRRDYGIDGFKFDGGNLEDFLFLPVEQRISVGRTWHCFGGDHYPFHEVKDTWNCGGKPYIQRLRDKYHCWGAEGLADLIPDALALSLTGHPFICPDMVGGGEWTCFTDGAKFDEELFVRFAQCSALFPMMQFSAAPWRILNEENREIVYRAQKLHSDMGEEIAAIAAESARTGEPMMRPLDYSYPNCGYACITDEFLLGDAILSAPVLQKGAVTRNVIFPPGVWQDANGNTFHGPSEAVVKADIACLPWYRKIS